MSFFKNRETREAKKLLRILKEFPWLWAVKSIWSPASFGQIEVRRATLSFMFEKPQEPRQVWFKVHLDELQKVISATQRPDQNLGEVSTEAISPGYHIEYIAIATTEDLYSRGQDFVILRDPNASEDLHRLCSRVGYMRSVFVPGRLVFGFIVCPMMETITKNLVDIWQGVVGYSHDGDFENLKRKKEEVNYLITQYGVALSDYLKPYCNLYQRVGKDQIRKYKSCRTGVLDDEQTRWAAAIVLCSLQDKERS